MLKDKTIPEILETKIALAAEDFAIRSGLPVANDPMAEVHVDPKTGLVDMMYCGPTHLAFVAACRQWLIANGHKVE